VLLWNVFTQVLLPILAMFGCGWLLDRRSHLDLHTLVKLNINVFVPSFMFVHVVGSDLSRDTAGRVLLFTLCVIASMFVVSALAAKALSYRREETRALQLATMFYNSGNYGIPLMSLAYPGTGPVLQVFIVLAQNISTFTVGLALAASSHRSGVRALLPMLRQVSLWAVAIAVLVRELNIPVMHWRWIWVPLNYFSEALVGIALLTLGAQLSKTAHQQSFSRLSWAVILRLLGGPLLACALVPLFGFHGNAATVMIVSAGFPTAVNTALLAHEFKADSQFAAAAVFYSTLASMFTVTALIAFLPFT
jgi:hypothetical protein